MQLGEIYRNLANSLITLVETKEVASIEAYAILSYVLQKPHSFLLAYQDLKITKKQEDYINKLLKERLTGKPMAYILGVREFWSLPLKVTKDTLIPRPDTETIVEQALLIADEIMHEKPQTKLRILDLGTGTGAIALALKSELKNATVDAIDVSLEALNVAKENSEKLKLEINLKQSDWFKNIRAQHQYHIIVSNPPYIADTDPHLNQGDVSFEPKLALVAQMNGFYDILNIIKETHNYLAHQGWLLIEHGYMQGSNVRQLFNTANFKKVSTKRDLGYNERVTYGQIEF